MINEIINEMEKTNTYCIETKSRFSVAIFANEKSEIFNAVAVDSINFITNQDGSLYLNSKSGLGAIVDLNKMNLENYTFILYINGKKVKELKF